MKKIQILISFTLMISVCFAQTASKKPAAKASSKKEATVSIKCTFDNCSVVDSLSLYYVNGLEKEVVSIARASADGSFTFQIPQPASPRFYMLGLNVDPSNVRPVLVSNTETLIEVGGPCFSMSETKIKNSKFNETYINAMQRLAQLKKDANKANSEYQSRFNDPILRSSAEKALANVDAQKLAFLDSLKKVNPYVAKIVALDTYTSFQSNPKKSQFKDEIEYFGKQYFQYVNWADADYNNIPHVGDLFKSYAQVIVLPQLSLSKAQQKAYFDNILKAIPAKSKTYKLALSGISTALSEAQNILLADMVALYNAEFPNEDMEYRNRMNMAVNAMKANMVNIPAPEIEQADTTGKMRKLSSLKGKYVLLDFWASWCGPCRRENPNVVRLYGKYKTKGFEVFSVSLDQTRDKWIKAIQDDGLVWDNHVSDLKYWSNEAARTYGVQSIPATILLDKEGNIIARNLRGPALEERLAQLLGE